MIADRALSQNQLNMLEEENRERSISKKIPPKKKVSLLASLILPFEVECLQLSLEICDALRRYNRNASSRSSFLLMINVDMRRQCCLRTLRLR